MTHKETWKKLERKVAKKLGGVRNPLSGKHSRHTSGDVIHPKFYIECKYRKNFAVATLFDEVRKNAKKESKIPILVLKEKDKTGELVVLTLDDFVKLIGEE
jgi:hypothetical protein